MNRYLFRILLVALISLLLGGCMSNPAYQEGRELAAEGQDELALQKFQLAISANPRNAEYLAAYIRLRERVIARLLDQGITAQRAGKDAEAEKSFRRVLDVDPANVRARNSLADLERDIRHRKLLAEAESAAKRQDYDLVMARLRTILGENPEHERAIELKRQISEKSTQDASEPRLSASLRKPITIEFKDAPLRQIFEVLSRTSGLNFVFDKEVRGDQRATIFLRNTSIYDALNLLLLTNQLEQRVLDANSILIYPNTAAKLKDYQSLTVKTFFLSHVDAKTAATTLKTIVKTKDIVVDEKQNLITMRDTPDAIRMAERLLALHDLPEPEVILEVAILEVARSRLLDLGIKWPEQLSLTPLAGPSGTLTLEDLKNLNSSTIGATLPPMIIKAQKLDGDINVLANPRIRAHNREAAKIMIGERVPNITTTSTSTGFASENIQYIDVGLKLEVQPTVYANNEVAIKIVLEVSNIVDKITTSTGGVAYQIGTRNATTLLRLKDGENQVLAGLIRDEDRSTGNKLPGFGDIPLLGRLFGSQRDESTKTEIVFSITPRLIRDARRPDFGIVEFDSGTESMVKIRAEGRGTAPVGVQVAASTSPALTTLLPVRQEESAPILGTANETQPGQTDLVLQGPNQVQIGSSFSVQFLIQPGAPVTSIPLALTFDPKVFQVTSVTEGDFLKQGQGNTNFSNRVDRNGGQVFATVTRSDQDGASRPGNIVVIGFKALAPASNSSIQITAVAPIGVGGSTVNASPPSPLIVTVTP